MIICNRKQGHYSDRRICEMIRYNPATSTFWLVVGLALKNHHTHGMPLRIESTERHTQNKQVIVVHYVTGFLVVKKDQLLFGFRD